MHFNISINVQTCDLRDIGGQYARKNASNFLTYDSYPSKTSFSKSDKNLVLRMRMS